LGGEGDKLKSLNNDDDYGDNYNRYNDVGGDEDGDVVL
jgi:hypothetical protein